MNILLADSRPLFHSSLLHQLLTGLIKDRDINTGVYIGAANHDRPEFYSLACSALNRLGLKKHCHLKVDAEQALDITAEPCMIILSGGSMDPGWSYLSRPYIQQWLKIQKILNSVFIGISAGAIHLSSGLNDAGKYQPYMHWVDATVVVHQEDDNWPSIKQLHKQNIKDVMAIPFNDGLAVGPQSIGSLQGRSFRHTSTDSIAHKIKIPAICLENFER